MFIDGSDYHQVNLSILNKAITNDKIHKRVGFEGAIVLSNTGWPHWLFHNKVTYWVGDIFHFWPFQSQKSSGRLGQAVRFWVF